MSLEDAMNITASTTFTPFPCLATELRLKIWSVFNNLSDARDVQVTVITRLSSNTAGPNTTSFKSLTSIPTLLHVCCKAREEGLKLYKTAFKVKGEDGKERGEIYVNPVSDLSVDFRFTGVGKL